MNAVTAVRSITPIWEQVAQPVAVDSNLLDKGVAALAGLGNVTGIGADGKNNDIEIAVKNLDTSMYYALNPEWAKVTKELRSQDPVLSKGWPKEIFSDMDVHDRQAYLDQYNGRRHQVLRQIVERRIEILRSQK